MSIKFKRTMNFYRGRTMPDIIHPSGERVYSRDTEGKDMRMFICGMELTAVTFHYFPSFDDVHYAMSRIRNPQYRGGHDPDETAPVALWQTKAGRLWVRVGEECIMAFGASFIISTLEESERRSRYVLSWIKARLPE